MLEISALMWVSRHASHSHGVTKQLLITKRTDIGHFENIFTKVYFELLKLYMYSICILYLSNFSVFGSDRITRGARVAELHISRYLLGFSTYTCACCGYTSHFPMVGASLPISWIDNFCSLSPARCSQQLCGALQPVFSGDE